MPAPVFPNIRSQRSSNASSRARAAADEGAELVLADIDEKACTDLAAELGAERVPADRVLVVEDGPTLTHGGMAYGAGYVAAAVFIYAPYVQYIDPHARGVLPESFSFVAAV